MKKVFLSVITYNSHDSTLECLDSLDRLYLSGIDLHVFVVDNASNTSFSLKDKKYKKFTPIVITSDKNLGFSGGHNIVLRRVIEEQVDYALVLNNDVTVDEHLLERLIKQAERDQSIGIVCPKIYFAKGTEFHKNRYKEGDLGKVIWYAGGEMDWANLIGHHRGVDEVDSGIYEHAVVTEFATGCCMLIKSTALREVGLFDERYFLYYEDADFSQRVRSAGFSIMFEPKAKLWHKNAASTGGSGSFLQDYFISRNRLLFGLHYAPPRTKFALIKESISLKRRGREWQKKGVTDFFLRKFGKGSYAV